MSRMRMAVVASMLAITGCSSPEEVGDTTGEPETESAAKLWVTGERLDRHSCPSEKCGVVGRLFFREGFEPLEEKDGWVRATKYYDASCDDGQSAYVDSGEKSCTEANGIVDGQFAEWVRKEGVSEVRPDDPADSATVDESLVAQSDDFSRYRQSFSTIAARLIREGRCTEADLREMGGFVKSVTDYRDAPVYFTYCGGMTNANKVYVNAETGKTVN